MKYPLKTDFKILSQKITIFLKKGLSKNWKILMDFILLAKNRLFTAVKLIHANTLSLQ